MATTVGSHGVAAFTNPSNGDALDATIVKGNDNTLRSAYVDHDSDGGVHVQSSSLASRPSAGTEGRKWITTDTGSVKLWYDNGAAWEEIDYVPNSGTATVDTLAVTNGATFDGDTLVVDHTNDRVGVNTASPTVALDVTGAAKVSAGLTVSASGAAITGDSTITGALEVTGASTLAAVSATTIQASDTVTITGAQGVTAQYSAGNTSTALTIDWDNGNSQSCTLTGNVTFTFSNPISGAFYSLYAVQNGTGGYSMTFPSTVRWEGGTPSFVTTANRATLMTFYYTGTRYIGSVVGSGVDVS